MCGKNELHIHALLLFFEGSKWQLNCVKPIVCKPSSKFTFTQNQNIVHA